MTLESISLLYSCVYNFFQCCFPSLTSRRTWIFRPHVSHFNRLGYLDPLQLSSCRSLLISLVVESNWVLLKRTILAYAILVSWIPCSGMSLTTSSLLKVHTCVHSPPPRTFRSTTFSVFRRGRQLPIDQPSEGLCITTKPNLREPNLLYLVGSAILCRFRKSESFRLYPVQKCIVSKNARGSVKEGGTLTNSIFGCIQIQKWVIPLNQAQFADGIRGVVCQVWTTGSLVLGKFRLFWVDFGHFQYGAISF